MAPPELGESWHARTREEVLALLGTNDRGLGPEDAARRREEYGPNAIERERGPGAWRILLRQFDSPIVLLLAVSCVAAVLIGKVTDAFVVLGAIVVNVVVGFLQEYRAGRAIEALASLVPERAQVVRGGEAHAIDAHELVPGDVLVVASGDRVPADVRLLSAKQLRVEEAALTGESAPVLKDPAPVDPAAGLGDRTGMLFGGTMVVAGAGTGVVVATGASTEIGRISGMLQAVHALETPLTKALTRVGRVLTVAVLVLAGALFGIAVARGYPVRDGLLVAITTSVASIPEGLPAIITIALAIGVQRMAARRAVVRRLPSVETLGSTTVICTDKTGTLTRNEMTVQALWTPHGRYEVTGIGYAPDGTLARGGLPVEVGEDVRRLVTAGVLCNDAGLGTKDGTWAITGDPTEAALVVAGEKLGIATAAARLAAVRLDGIPFDSAHQYMATLHNAPGSERHLVVKGAPEVLLPRCRDRALADRALKAAHDLASRGLRVLAIAERSLRTDHVQPDDVAELELLGLEGMLDPPRPEAIEAIRACQSAGITVKMITGDHVGTAEAIGAQLGLVPPGSRGLTGRELATMDEAVLREKARTTNVFARVAPEHKLALVRALQADGQVVAMTGDGINDAPALKQADVGVAMGATGTAVAREASDVVLVDDNFATVAAAVEEGRRIYDNLRKSLAFVLPTNMGLGLLLVAAVLFFPVMELGGGNVPLLPVTPSQLLWVNLVTSVALTLPLALEVKEPNVMRRPPRRVGEPILGSLVVWRSLLTAALLAGGAVGLFLWEFTAEEARVGDLTALREAQTMSVCTVVFFQCFYLLNCRSLTESVFRIGFFSNRSVFAGIGLLLVLQAVLVYVPFMHRVFGTAPLGPRELIVSAAVGATVLPVISFEKWLRARPRRERRALPITRRVRA